MKVYVVFQKGVYRHECGGVFSTLEAAEDASSHLIDGEDDDYHTYEVVPFELDLHTPSEGESPALCNLTRKNGVVSKTYNKV